MTEFPPTDDTVELVHRVVGKNHRVVITSALSSFNGIKKLGYHI